MDNARFGLTLDHVAALRHTNPCSFGGDDLGADPMPMFHDVSQVLGDCSGFYLQQARRLLKFGVDIDGLAVSRLAFRRVTDGVSRNSPEAGASMFCQRRECLGR